MVKVKVLKVVGPYLPGDEIEVDPETAVHLCDGIKAMLWSDFQKLETSHRDLSRLSVKEMLEMNIKNVQVEEAAELHKAIEQAHVDGKPLAHGEPLVPVGGITPPTTVFPKLADLAGHPVTKLEELKVKKVDQKAEDKPEPKKK